MLSAIRQIIADLNPDINTKIGSAIYYLVVLPTSKIYDVIQGLITGVATNMHIYTATNKDPLIDNFGVTRGVGSKGSGTLFIKMQNVQLSYFFPKGSTFSDVAGNILVSTMDILVTDTYMVTIPVETLTSTSRIYSIGSSFIPTIFSSYVDLCYVSSQICGGTDVETDEQVLARIKEKLSQSANTKQGFINIIKKQFPKVIDIVVKDNEVICKLPLSVKEVTNTDVIMDTVLYVYDNLAYEIFNYGTIDEVVKFSTTYETIKYISGDGLKDIVSYIKSTMIGFNPVIKQAECVFIKSLDSSMSSYILEHPLTPFRIKEIPNIISYPYPLILETYNSAPITSEIDSYTTAYYTM